MADRALVISASAWVRVSLTRWISRFCLSAIQIQSFSVRHRFPSFLYCWSRLSCESEDVPSRSVVASSVCVRFPWVTRGGRAEARPGASNSPTARSKRMMSARHSHGFFIDLSSFPLPLSTTVDKEIYKWYQDERHKPAERESSNHRDP